jgi:O-antigen/teichoic acid export membrane protein
METTLDEPKAERPPASIARSAMWSTLDFWTQQTAGLLTLIVVGNMIGPEAVGVLVIAQLAVSLAMTAILDGLSDALIQRKNLAPEHFDSALWLLLAIGVVAGLALALAAPFVAAIFRTPDLTLVLQLLAIGLPLAAVSAAYQGMLQRDLKFRMLAIRSLVASSTAFIAAFIMARFGFGVFSLVGYFVISRFLDAAFLVTFSRLSPGLRVTRTAVQEIFDFGKHRMGNQLVGFIAMQIDRFSVAFFLGPLAAGLYSVAERITAALHSGAAGVVFRVSFPVLSTRQDDALGFDRAIKNFLLAVNAIIMPIFVGLALTSREIVSLLFTSSWESAAPILAILSLAAIPAASKLILSAGINALGRPDIAVRYSVVIMMMRLIASLSAAQFGLQAVAWANLIVTVSSAPIVVFFTQKLLRIGLAGVASAVRAPATAVGLMAAVTWLVGEGFAGTPALPLLCVKVLTGVISYTLALYFLAPSVIRQKLPRFIAPRAVDRPGEY